MTIKPLKDIPPHLAYKRCKLQRLLDEFIHSGCNCAELVYDPGEYSSAKSLQSAIINAAKRWKCPVEVCVRKGHVYLLRSDSIEDSKSSFLL